MYKMDCTVLIAKTKSLISYAVLELFLHGSYNSIFNILPNQFQTKDNPSTVDFVTKVNTLKSHDGFTRVLFSSYCKKVNSDILYLW